MLQLNFQDKEPCTPLNIMLQHPRIQTNETHLHHHIHLQALEYFSPYFDIYCKIPPYALAISNKFSSRGMVGNPSWIYPSPLFIATHLLNNSNFLMNLGDTQVKHEYQSMAVLLNRSTTMVDQHESHANSAET